MLGRGRAWSIPLVVVGTLVLSCAPGSVARATEEHRTTDVLAVDLLKDRLGPADPDQRLDVLVTLADPKLAEERALANAVVDPHSPAQFRADGASINSDGFHEAFGTKPGDKMWKAPADRLRLW